MPDIEKVTLPDNNTYDLISKTTKGIVRCELASISGDAATVTVAGVTSLYDGLTLYIQNNISPWTVWDFSYATLNVNNLGAKDIKGSNSYISAFSRWLTGTSYLFVYNATADIWEIQTGKGTVTSVTIKGTSPIVSSSSSAIKDEGTVTLSHATSGVTSGNYGDTSAQTPDYGDTFKVPSFSVDDKGHVTVAGEHTVTIPASEISGLDGNITGSPSTSKTLSAFSETDGVVSATFSDISITKSQVSDFPTVDTVVTSGSSNLITSGAVYTAIDNLPEPMIFKGTLGTGGTISALPTASASNEGWVYKVITAGTYDSQAAKVGDVFACATLDSGTTYEWIIIPAGDTDSDTWRNIKVNGTEKLGSAISSGAVDFVDGTYISASFDGTGSKVAFSHDTSGVTAGSYGDTSDQTPSYGDTFKVPSMTVDSQGHVTVAGEHTVTIPSREVRLRVYRQTSYSNTYPLIAARTRDSSIGTEGSDGSSSAVYGLINDDTDKTPKINMGTGALTAKSFVGDISGGTGLTSTQVTTALGYTPYDSTNPDGYTSVTVPNDILAFDAGTQGIELLSGDDVDNLDIGKTYYSPNSSRSALLTGTPPVTGSGFKIVTYRNYYTNHNYDFQFATSSQGRCFIRYRFNSSNTWEPWAIFYTSANLPITDGNPTLDWGTQSTVATIGSTDIHVTMPSNPNTDESVTQKLTSTNYDRPLLMSTAQTSSSTSEVNGLTFRDNSIYANPSTGNVGATTFNGYTLADACAKSVDTAVTNGSSNLVTSGAVYTYAHLGVTRNSKGPSSYATFTTDLNEPLVKCTVQINPLQDGSGVPTPSNVRSIVGRTNTFVIASKQNLYDRSYKSIVVNGYIALSGSRLRSSDTARTIIIPCKPNTTYTISKLAGARFFVAYAYEYPEFEATNGVRGIINDNTASSLTITTDARAKYLCAYVFSGTNDSVSENVMMSSIQIEYGSSASTFSAFEGNYYTYDFNQTVYGGTVDLASGLLTLTYGMTTYDGSADEAWSANSAASGFHIENIDFDGNFVDGLSNLFPIRTSDETWSDYVSIRYGFGSASYPNRLCVYKATTLLTDVTDVASWKTWLSTNNLVCVYKLYSPIKVNLAPQPVLAQTSAIATGAGSTPCYVSADCGDTSVTYNLTLQYMVDANPA